MTPSGSIDVVIPAYNEASHIESCLDHVLAHSYPPHLVAVWVVDAGSSDRTAAIVAERAEREPRLHLITGRGRLNAGQAMNAGIEQGSGELIARVDAHTYLASDYLGTAAEIMAGEEEDVAGVGGQPIFEGETRFGRANALARRSRFGVAGSVYTEQRRRTWVDTVQGGVYRRSALDQAGRFAEGMLVGEDIELNWRLRRSGYRILLDTRLRFRYTTRSSWRAAFRQYRNYGQARVRTLAAHPRFLRPRHLAPSLFAVGLGALAVAAPGSGGARRALAVIATAYTAGAAVAGVKAAWSEEPGLAPRVAACFPALHFGYAVGMMQGLAVWAAARLGLTEPRTAVDQR
jgi:succinoglycan biosynthesis protein ExoA